MFDNLGLAVLGTAYVGYFISDSLSSFWGHLLHFA